MSEGDMNEQKPCLCGGEIYNEMDETDGSWFWVCGECDALYGYGEQPSAVPALPTGQA